MSSVDNRIVQMKFDNKQFEDGAKTSISTLDKLKRGLNLEESAKSLSNLEKAGRTFTLSNIGESVDTLASKFSALHIIGITALVNITNSAVNAGKALLNSLTIAPISEGFADYNRKLTSVQTIMNATGKDIKTVSAYFSELDTYADKTIYNLDDMTSAFAKFTNAGVDMDKSVPAIKGIANMVALAGQDAGAAQIAFYNLSQSIAGGFLTTTDYKSLNLANVATKEWKQQMIQGAIAAGTLKKTAKGMYMIKGAKEATTEAALFNEELSKGWATTDVLLKVLGKYGDANTDLGKKAYAAAQDIKSFGMMVDTLKAQVGTGWTDTFEILIGNLEESKALFTPLTNTIGAFIDATANARNNILAFWKANGGREALIQSFVNLWNALLSVLKPIGDAYRAIFPPATGQALVTFSKILQTVTAHLKIGDATAYALKMTFEGLFAILDLGIKAFKLIAGAIGLVVKMLLPGANSLGDGIVYVTGVIGQYIVKLNDSIDKNELLKSSLNNIAWALNEVKKYASIAIDYLGPIFAKAIEKTGPVLSNLWAGLKDLVGPMTVFASTLKDTHDAFEPVQTVSDRLKTSFDNLHKTADTVKNVISGIATAIKKTLGPVLVYIKDKIDKLSLQDIAALLTGGGFLILAKTLKDGLGGVNEILEGLGKTLKAFTLKVKAEALLKIAIALGILAAALLVLSFIKMEDLAKSLGALAVTLTMLVIGLKALSGQSKGIGQLGNMLSQFGSAVQIMAIGAAVLMLAGALKIIASIDRGKLIQGTIAIGVLLTMIGTFMALTRGGALAMSAGGLIGFATGITILSGALAILGNMKYETLKQGTIALGTLMVVIAAFVNLTRGGDLATSAGGLMGFATGILILSGALTILGKMKYETLKQGILVISTLMIVIAAFVDLTRGGDLIKSAGGLSAFAVGILLLTSAMTILGKLDAGKVVQGTLAITTLMTVIAAFINLTKSGDLATSSAGLIGFAAGITVLAAAVTILAKLDSGKLTQGVIAISVLMTAIATFITVTKNGDLKKSASGLIGFATGLAILCGAIAILSALNTDKLIMASVAVSTLMAAIGLFVNLTNVSDLAKSAGGLTIFAGAIVIVAGALQLIGSMDVKTLLVGIGGIVAMLVILGASAVIIAPLAPAIVTLSAAIAIFGVSCGIVSLAMVGFAGALSVLANTGTAGADVLVTAVKKVVDLIPYVLQKLGEGIIAFADVISKSGPVLTAAMVTVLESIINAIVTETPKIVGSLLNMLTQLLTTIANNMPNLITAGINIILAILKGIYDNIVRITTVAVDIMVRFINGISSKMQDIVNSAFNLIISFINGLANAIRNNHNKIYDAVGNLISAIIGAIVDLNWKVANAGQNIVSGLIDGMKSMIKSAANWGANLGTSVLDSAKKALGIHSPSRAFAEVGKFSALGFAEGLNNFSGVVSSQAQSVGMSAMDSLKNVMSTIGDVVSGNMDMNPTIRPVLDLGSVTAGVGVMDSLFNKTRGITVDSANIKAASISNRFNAGTGISQNGSGNSGSSTDVTGVNQQPIYVTVVSELDGREIARVTAPAMSEELYNIRKKW